MRVVPSGLPAWRGGFGMVTLRITDLGQRDGHALRCMLRAATPPERWTTTCRPGSASDGTCTFRAPGTDLSIIVMDDDTGEEVGRVVTTIARGLTATVTVSIEGPSAPRRSPDRARCPYHGAMTDPTHALRRPT